MNCEKIKVQLSAYIDGELPEKDATVIREHISVCADCAQEEQLHRRTSQLLKSWENVPAPAGACEALLARAEDLSRRPRRSIIGEIPHTPFARAFSKGLIRAVRPLAGPRALIRVAFYGAAVALLCVAVVFFVRSPLRRAPLVEPHPTMNGSATPETDNSDGYFDDSFRYTTMAEIKVAEIWK